MEGHTGDSWCAFFIARDMTEALLRGKGYAYIVQNGQYAVQSAVRE